MYLDASALVAILVDEPEAVAFQEKALAAAELFTSPISIWETVVAVSRVTGMPLAMADDRLTAYLATAEVQIIAIGAEEGRIALETFDRFGKGRHPARLNMGDCFAYACARTRGIPLLYKGDDFSKTDMAAA